MPVMRCTGILVMDYPPQKLIDSIIEKNYYDRGTTLENNGVLHQKQYLNSGNGYYAVVQDDGNFVVYKG